MTAADNAASPVLVALTEGLDLDDWDDHHRAQEIVAVLTDNGFEVVPSDVAKLGRYVAEYADKYDDTWIDWVYEGARVERPS